MKKLFVVMMLVVMMVCGCSKKEAEEFSFDTIENVVIENGLAPIRHEIETYENMTLEADYYLDGDLLLAKEISKNGELISEYAAFVSDGYVYVVDKGSDKMWKLDSSNVHF